MLRQSKNPTCENCTLYLAVLYFNAGFFVLDKAHVGTKEGAYVGMRLSE